MRLTLIGLALLTGTLLTAGSGLALVEAIGMVGAYGQSQADATCDYAAYASDANACQTAFDTAAPLVEPAVASFHPTVAFGHYVRNKAMDSVAGLASDAQGKAQVAQATATAIAANVQGQAYAAADLAAGTTDSVKDFASQAGADVDTKAELVEDVALSIARNLYGQANATTSLAQEIAADSLATADAMTAMEREALLSVTPLVQVIVNNAVFAKQEAETIALSTLQQAPEDPQDASTDAVGSAAELAVTMALEKQAAANAVLNAVIEA